MLHCDLSAQPHAGNLIRSWLFLDFQGFPWNEVHTGCFHSWVPGAQHVWRDYATQIPMAIFTVEIATLQLDKCCSNLDIRVGSPLLPLVLSGFMAWERHLFASWRFTPTKFSKLFRGLICNYFQQLKHWREREGDRDDLFCIPCFQEVRQNFLRYINLGQRPSECFQSTPRPFCLWFFLE
jgi:hypothetical protein